MSTSDSDSDLAFHVFALLLQKRTQRRFDCYTGFVFDMFQTARTC